ncbi:alpha/beta fold hydrolase [Photorhabdus akhurstii]|uniref:alpha/beta fold hydrolase n=1 Tax=Photorhabdus akhurstii TaxID=171438 RepID=UPI00052C7BD0|nr:alpha/beta hydrolase [Photorhabdus akhurstii]KGM29673.1 epoxide hydrolase [Photorhabdus luminescens]MBS9427330.1 alpha/beta hydrolase [Photorhabdus akhurstii]
MAISQYDIHTSHAVISVADTGGDGLPVLLIHGNSSCKEVFRHQINCFGDEYRILAIDLPGHGASSNAEDPRRTYSISGYALCIIEVLEKLGIDKVAVFGWSLGGHIGLELISRFSGIVGLMICGTPPVSPGAENVRLGFKPSRFMAISGKALLTEEEITDYTLALYGKDALCEPFLRAAVARTDGLARQYMSEASVSPDVMDQRLLVETNPTPLAIVNGAEDLFVNIDYINGITYKNLWTDQVYNLLHLGHGPFWESPELFNRLMAGFFSDLTLEM